MRYFSVFIDGKAVPRWKVITGLVIMNLGAFALFILCLSLIGCSTMRRAICPPAHVSTVTETDHAYIVTVEAECRTITEKIPK